MPELLTGSASVENSVINGEITVHKSTNRLTIHYQLNVKVTNDPNRSNGYTNFMNRTIELCDFFANPASDPLHWMIFREIVANKNHKIVTKCPIEIVKE